MDGNAAMEDVIEKRKTVDVSFFARSEMVFSASTEAFKVSTQKHNYVAL